MSKKPCDVRKWEGFEEDHGFMMVSSTFASIVILGGLMITCAVFIGAFIAEFFL